MFILKYRRQKQFFKPKQYLLYFTIVLIIFHINFSFTHFTSIAKGFLQPKCDYGSHNSHQKNQICAIDIFQLDWMETGGLDVDTVRQLWNVSLEHFAQESCLFESDYCCVDFGFGCQMFPHTVIHCLFSHWNFKPATLTYHMQRDFIPSKCLIYSYSTIYVIILEFVIKKLTCTHLTCQQKLCLVHCKQIP